MEKQIAEIISLRERNDFMNTLMFQEKRNIKMIAHRGLSGLELENTCPAFVAAGVKSYYGIETDVHVTRDGKYILCHDDDLKRIAGLDLVVEETDFDTLRAVRLKDTDGKSMREDLFFPTLEEYFTICKKYDKYAVLELKNRMPAHCVSEIVQKIQELGWLHKTVFISFCGENLIDLKKIYPQAVAQYLFSEIGEDKIRFMIEHDLEADCYFGAVTKDFVDAVHKAGKRVNVWTVNTLEDAEKLKALGVDMMTTNILE